MFQAVKRNNKRRLTMMHWWVLIFLYSLLLACRLFIWMMRDDTWPPTPQRTFHSSVYHSSMYGVISSIIVRRDIGPINFWRWSLCPIADILYGRYRSSSWVLTVTWLFYNCWKDYTNTQVINMWNSGVLIAMQRGEGIYFTCTPCDTTNMSLAPRESAHLCGEECMQQMQVYPKW